MAVARQEYTLSATWTAGQMANAFRDAFIDAGYMTAWYDSFLSGSIENRILEVVYDAAKTYGKTYYWFMFDTGTVRISVASGWNTTTKVPTGTLYLDYWSTTTNSGGNHSTLANLSTTVNATLVRYTSQTSSTHTWFSLRPGARVFTISQPAHGVPSWVDLNKTFFHHFLRIIPRADSNAGGVSIASWETLRRSAIFGSVAKGHTSLNNLLFPVACYSAIGRQSNSYNFNAANQNYGSTGNSPSSPVTMNIILPIYEASVNPAFSTDVNPVYTCLPTSLYLTNSNMPNDLGIVFYYADNTMVSQDKFIVDAGVEEWEILAVANNSTKTTGASAAIVARVV